MENGSYSMGELVENLLDVVGATLEVIGGLYLANRYLSRIKLRQIPWSIITVIWKGEPSEDMAFMAEISEELPIQSLKGIFCLILGFIVRSSPHIFYLLKYIFDSVHYYLHMQ